MSVLLEACWVEEAGLAVGLFAGDDLGQEFPEAGGVFEAVAAVPAGDDDAGLAGEAADEELAVGGVGDQARDDLGRPGIQPRERAGLRRRPGRRYRCWCGCSGRVLRVDAGAAGQYPSVPVPILIP